MNKIKIFRTVLVFLFGTMSFILNAQTVKNSEFFVGKWTVDFKDLPAESTIMVFTLENKNGNYTGIVSDTKGNEIAKIDKSESDESELTIYFTAGGYDLNVVFKKIDENQVSATLLDQFEGKGDRMLEKK